MATLSESSDTLVVEERMRPAGRVVLALLALFPLLAPYELLVRPGWDAILNLFFVFAALISLGAMLVSAFLFWAAVAGIDSLVRFDRAAGTFTYTGRAPVMPARRRVYPLAAVRDLKIVEHDWSDGAPSYTLEVRVEDGQSFRSASSWSRAEMEAIHARVIAFLDLARGR